MYSYLRFDAHDLLHRTLSAELMEASWGPCDYARTEFLNWQYLKNPDGPVVGYLVLPENQNAALACQYVTVPSRLWNPERGGLVPCLLSVNTVTHPAHRKKGLFIEAAKRTFDCARDAGYAAVYGFPNDSSLPGFKRLQFAELAPLQLFISVPRPFAALGRSATILRSCAFPPLVQGCVRSSCTREGWDAHIVRIKDLRPAALKSLWHVPRDVPWLGWRYWDHPAWKYSFFTTQAAAFVLRFMTLADITVGVVLEVLGAPTGKCFAEMRAFAEQQKPVFLCGVFPSDTFKLYPGIEKVLRWRIPQVVAPKKFHLIYLPLRDASVLPSRTYFSLGDFDLY